MPSLKDIPTFVPLSSWLLLLFLEAWMSCMVTINCRRRWYARYLKYYLVRNFCISISYTRVTCLSSVFSFSPTWTQADVIGSDSMSISSNVSCSEQILIRNYNCKSGQFIFNLYFFWKFRYRSLIFSSLRLRTPFFFFFSSKFPPPPFRSCLMLRSGSLIINHWHTRALELATNIIFFGCY